MMTKNGSTALRYSLQWHHNERDGVSNHLSIVCSSVCSGADQIKHQSSTSLAFVRGIHRWPVDSPHKGPVTRTIFPFDDVIIIAMMQLEYIAVRLIEMSRRFVPGTHFTDVVLHRNSNSLEISFCSHVDFISVCDCYKILHISDTTAVLWQVQHCCYLEGSNWMT